jgi:hypothetical protein
VTRRELALAIAVAVAVALLMHWPLPLHLGSDVPRDLGDPLPQAWQVAWDGHALLHQPVDWFQANIFWPLPNSLAFSDALVGYAPAGLIGAGPHAAIFRYDVLFLFAYALAFVGAYLLARELGTGRAGAFVAGAAFAYAPWRLEQDGHLHVLSSGGIPLALALLVRGYRRSSPATVVAGWLVATWQLSLGFTLGIPFAYLLALLGAGAALWAWRRGVRPPRGVLVASGVGVLVLLATAFVLARPYLAVGRDHPEAKRSEATLRAYSSRPVAYLAAPGANSLWGPATKFARRQVRFSPEQTLFPGVAVVLLAMVCLALRGYRRGLLIGLALDVLVVGWLALGFHDDGFPWPYRLLYEHAPGFESSRTPGRLNTLTSLALALLAAGGASALLARVRRPRLRAALAAGLVVVVLVEGAGFEGLDGPAHPTVPAEPAALHGLPDPQLHLPMSRVGNRRYVLWSSDGFPRLVNGRASFNPSLMSQIAWRVRDFPDRASVGYLRRLGVRVVVLHPGFARGTSWAGAERRPVAGLGLSRERRGAVVVYRLGGGARGEPPAQ